MLMKRVFRYGAVLMWVKFFIVTAGLAFTYAIAESKTEQHVPESVSITPMPGWLTAKEAPCGYAFVCDKAAAPPVTTIYSGDYLSVTY